MSNNKKNIFTADDATFRIGLISDTHEWADIAALPDQLQALDCDAYVHLGDVGGSPRVMRAVRQFKRSLGGLDGLTEQQKQDYHRLLREGLSPMRAYGAVVVGADTASLGQQRRETLQSYQQVLAALGELDNAYCLTGNVDRSLFSAEIVPTSAISPTVNLVTVPLLLDHGDSAVMFWPSMRGAEPKCNAALQELLPELLARVQGKRRVVVFGHEQLFKGPPPVVYKSRVNARGLDFVTIPWFEPSSTRKHLITFFRQLPPDVEAAYVFGHVHDAQDVIEAGIPGVKDAVGPHMRYRLYGLGQRVLDRDRERGLRRQLAMYYVPIDSVAVLTLTTNGIGWEVHASE